MTLIMLSATDSSAADITIPKSVALDKLTLIICSQTQISIAIANEVNQDKLFFIQLPIPVSAFDLLISYTQTLSDHDIAVVLSGEVGGGSSYRVVPLRDAVKASVTMDAVALAKMTYPPGYVSITMPLRFLGLDAATTVITPVVGASGAVRPLGAGQPVLVINGFRPAVQAAIQLLTSLDTTESQPVVRSIVPTHASPQRAQATVSAAWASMQKLGAVTGQADILISADGSTLLLVGHPTAVT
jgi:hypothetical protein